MGLYDKTLDIFDGAEIKLMEMTLDSAKKGLGTTNHIDDWREDMDSKLGETMICL